MNVDLLNRVKQVILEEPRRLSMGVFVADAAELSRIPEDLPPCGTVACIAGWAVLLHDFGAPDELDTLPAEELVGRRAQLLLDLTAEQAWHLFQIENWPFEFYRDYSGEDHKTKAEVTARRIDHFVATNGED